MIRERRAAAITFPFFILFVVLGFLVGAEVVVLQHGNLPDAGYTQHATTLASDYPRSDGRKGGDLYVGCNAPGKVMRSLLDFDLSPLPEGAVVEDLHLRLYQSAAPNSIEREVTLELWSLDQVVREAGATWNDPDGDGQPGDAGGRLGVLLQSATVSPQRNGELFLPASDAFLRAVRSSVTAGEEINLLLKLANEQQPDRCLLRFRGNEYEGAVSRPSLTLRFSGGTADAAVGARIRTIPDYGDLPQTDRLTLVNYSEGPIYATAVSLPSELLSRALGVENGTPLKALRAQGEALPMYASADGESVRAYLSLAPREKMQLQLQPAAQWGTAMASGEFDRTTSEGYIRNGLLRLDYRGRNWDLHFDGPDADRVAPYTARQIVRNGEIDIWLDNKNRGRLLNYTPKDLYGLGLLHTSDARLVDGEVRVAEDGSISLQLVRTFGGFAQGVTWTQTYTLLPGLPQLLVGMEFTASGEDEFYLAYVNQGSGLAGQYGELLREKPLFKYVDPSDPAALIAGGLSSPLMRVAWRPERCWVGFSAPSGAGLGITTCEETKALDRGSTVWNVNRSDFRITLIEEEQKHFPFVFSGAKPFVNRLSLLGTSGGVDMWGQTKNLFASETAGKPLDLLQAYAVFLGDVVVQPGYVDRSLVGADCLLESERQDARLAAVRLNPVKRYFLRARSSDNRSVTLRLKDLSGSQEAENLTLTDEVEGSIELAHSGRGGDPSGLLVRVEPGDARLAEFSVSLAPLDAPELSTPRDGQLVTDFAVFFRWKKVPGVIDYELQYARNAAFKEVESRMVRMETPLAFYMPGDEELPAPGRWYWRVRAMDGEREGRWSAVRSMEVNDDHSRKPVPYDIRPDQPLFTYEGCRVPRGDVENFRDIIREDLRPHVAYVFSPLEESGLSPQEKLVEYYAPLAGSEMRFFTRSLHPGTMAEHFNSLSEVEAVFQHNPNVMGDEGGEAMSVLYREGATKTYSHRLIRLCAKYGKLFYMADGTYPLDNKWEEMYAREGAFMEEYKDYVAFAQKNNILQRQMVSQSSVLGLYLSGAITNQGAWEDGGWYWQQVGFRGLGELYGRRGGDVRAMPRIFWALNFVMGISRGTAIFSLEGQTGTAPPMSDAVRDIDKPLTASPHAYWTRDGQILPTYERFIEPLLRAIVEHDLVPTKEQVMANVRIAVYNDGIEATDEQEPYYRQYQPLYAGTYGFKPMLDYPGELYEFFPNTGRYYFIPVLPQGMVDLGPGIRELPLSELMDQDKVREIFDAAYPEWYSGDALVTLVGDILTVLNSNENQDQKQSYRVPLDERGIFRAIEGEVEVHSYLIGKFEDENSRLWMQANTEYPERETRFSLFCVREPQVRITPASAAVLSQWDAASGQLRLRLSHDEGAVELTLE